MTAKTDTPNSREQEGPVTEAATRYRAAHDAHHEASMTQRAGFDTTRLDALADAEREASAALLKAALGAPEVPQGWKLAPVEPSEAMLEAATGRKDGYVNLYRADDPSYEAGDVWRAMLAAAPPPEGSR